MSSEEATRYTEMTAVAMRRSADVRFARNDNLLVAGICGRGSLQLVVRFFANETHEGSLIKRGYLTLAQAGEQIASPETHVRLQLVRIDARICKHCGVKYSPRQSINQLTALFRGEVQLTYSSSLP
jgi:hypothetical protein